MASNHNKDEAVEAIIAQAMDQVALEQIAAINTSHLTDADVLPTALESRFRTLKSLPKPKPILDFQPQERNTPENPLHRSEDKPTCPIPSEDKPTSPIDQSPPAPRPPALPRPTVVMKSRERSVSSSPDSFPRGKQQQQQQVMCCFGFSPKKRRSTAAKKGRKGKGELGPKKKVGDGGDWMEEKEDEFLADVGTLSILKEQKRKIKKALKEQEKVSRETEKLVELVKQASMKLDFSASIDELLSDDDDEKFF